MWLVISHCGFDPREVLADIVAQCRAAGLNPAAACELEFYLIDL